MGAGGRRPGVAQALAALSAVALIAAACGDLTPTIAPVPTSSAATLPTEAASAGTPTAEPPGPTAQPPGPTEVPPAPTEEPPAPTPEGSPSASVPPMVDTFKVKRSASCLGANGTDQVGSIKLSWTTSGTTGVRISIDPPSPDVAYDFGFGDYGPSGSAIVPFACDPPGHDANGDYHLYVIWTLHATNKAAYYRFAKVYDITPEPTP